MDDAECLRIRRRLHERGILVCDLERPSDADSSHRRWLVGTFALAPVVMTLAQETVPVLYTERAQPLEITDSADGELGMSRREQIEFYGAERVCRTNSYKGSLMIAIAANEMALSEPELRDGESPLLGQVIERLGDQPSQWVGSA
jgi:hypothetical protein